MNLIKVNHSIFTDGKNRFYKMTFKDDGGDGYTPIYTRIKCKYLNRSDFNYSKEEDATNHYMMNGFYNDDVVVKDVVVKEEPLKEEVFK